MRIPDSKIDDVRMASDIVDVISSYVRLKKRGKNYLGLCPFHQEKTPSFNVSPEKQMYHCFGCGVGGNVFTFVMEYEKVSFVDAVRTLADRAGMSLPEEGAEDKAQATENEVLYEVCRKVGLHFHANLTNTTEGKLALEYFHHRGFTDETIRKFGLGYSMHSWDDVIKFGERETIDIGILEKAGLVIRREDGTGFYDRFRGRAIFPIFSTSGRTLGFGARKMRDDDPLGKYINSPETPIHNKSRNLYGLFQSKDAVRGKEHAILVEGYADLISVFQAGIQNVVASSGTALTVEQVQLIGRYAKNIIVVYDADSAGSKATIRGVDLIIENGLEVKIAELPEGEDPDSFVTKHGGEAFEQLVRGAVSFLDFKVKLFEAQGLLNTPEGQARTVRSIVETIAKMKDELQRSFYITSLSQKYRLYESVLYRELEKVMGGEKGQRHNDRRSAPTFQEESPEAPTPSVTIMAEPSTPEHDLLKLMLENGNEMVGFVFSHIAPEMFTHTLAQNVVHMILRHVNAGTAWDAGTLINEASDPGLDRFIAAILSSKYELSKGWAERDALPEEVDPWYVAERSIAILRKKELDRHLAENQRLMKEASQRGEPVKEYLEQHQAMLEERKKLESRNLVNKGNAQ